MSAFSVAWRSFRRPPLPVRPPSEPYAPGVRIRRLRGRAMPEEPHAPDDEQCPDLAEADALGDAFARIFAGVVVCAGCAGLVHRNERRCVACGREKPRPS